MGGSSVTRRATLGEDPIIVIGGGVALRLCGCVCVCVCVCVYIN